MREQFTLPLPNYPGSPDNEERSEQELLESIQYTIDNWLHEHASEPYSPEKLTALVEFLGAEQQEALKTLSASFDDTELYPRRPSIKLFGEQGQDEPSLSLNGWREGEESSIHDHTNTEGAYHVFEGNLDEEIFNVGGMELENVKDHAEGVPVQVTTRSLGEGETISIPTPYVHRVKNNDKKMTLTIHGYYPQLSNLRYYNSDGNNLSFIEDAKSKRARLAKNQ